MNWIGDRHGELLNCKEEGCEGEIKRHEFERKVVTVEERREKERLKTK